MPRPAMLDRLAGAPISWGVCEVPGWGVELPAERVLAEMRDLGLAATEFGPIGYLGADAPAVKALLDRAEVALVGGFLPVVLHEPESLDEALALAGRTAVLYASCGAAFLVSTAVTDYSWSPPRPLTDREWEHLCAGLARLDEVAAQHGLTHVFHPHAETLVETGEQLSRVLEGSAVRLCLDTGHLTIGEADCVALVEEAPDRIAHVHLKDVSLDVAKRLRKRELSLLDAVRAGLFRPLGDGDAPVAEVISALDRAGYEGWLVLEQDVALAAEPAPGEGPLADTRRSIEFLEALPSQGVGRDGKGGTDGRIRE